MEKNELEALINLHEEISILIDEKYNEFVQTPRGFFWVSKKHHKLDGEMAGLHQARIMIFEKILRNRK